MSTDKSIDYVELPGGELPATKAFYADAFGWTFTDYGPIYSAFDNAGLDGGLNGEQPTAAPLVIVYADDLERSLADVERAGGKVTAPIYSFPGGRRFHFRDPAGNELGVWSDK